jgi:hypothetical protein
MNLFTPKQRSSNSLAIKNWTQEALSLHEEAVVMVSELQCHEPDCPPIETVIIVIETGNEQRMFKVHKAIDELTREEVVDVIRNGHKH